MWTVTSTGQGLNGIKRGSRKPAIEVTLFPGCHVSYSVYHT